MTWLSALAADSTVVLHTSGEMSFRGIRVRGPEDCLVLREARVLDADGESTALDGELIVPREQVHFVQLLSTAPAGAEGASDG